MENQIYLGIDPGFHFTGFSILKLENNKTYLLECNCLQMNSKDTLSKRVGLFYNTFNQKILTYKVTNIVLETSFLGRNAQVFLKLGYLRGVLYLLADQNQINITEFAPTQIKQILTGFGGASKDQVALALKVMFPQLQNVLKNAKSDVSDSLAITLCGVWQNQLKNRLGKIL